MHTLEFSIAIRWINYCRLWRHCSDRNKLMTSYCPRCCSKRPVSSKSRKYPSGSQGAGSNTSSESFRAEPRSGLGCLKDAPACSGEWCGFWLQVVNRQPKLVAVMPGPADIERVIGINLCITVLVIRICVTRLRSFVLRTGPIGKYSLPSDFSIPRMKSFLASPRARSPQTRTVSPTVKVAGPQPACRRLVTLVV